MRSHRTVLGILAHVDAGKTTLTEAILYKTGVIRQKGRVDHRDTFLDTDAAERSRGITVYTKCANFQIHSRLFTLIDTPGHTDFSPEMERCLQVLDYAVLVVSAAEGIQPHTETIWRLLEQYRVPVCIFVNKTDREGVDLQGVQKQLQELLHPACMEIRRKDGVLSPETIEEIAALDEAALELYMEGRPTEQWDAVLSERTARRACFPCFFGSALQDIGIDAFLEGLEKITLPPVWPDSFSGRLYQVRHDANGNSISFLKITGGTLHTKDWVEYLPPSGRSESGRQEKIREKADEIRLYNGEKWQLIHEAQAGDICAVTGLSSAVPGTPLGGEAHFFSPRLLPVLSVQLLLPSSVSQRVALEKLALLEREQPELQVKPDPRLEAIHLHIMGTVQLEILKDLLLRKFGWDVSFGPCKILYKETVRAPVMGYGHYEPLRHYAEVHLRIEPGIPGQGVLCKSECSTDILDRNFQNLILGHIREKEHMGILTGSPLTDVTIVLTAGRNHLKHTVGGDFRQATYRAIRQGLEKADNQLLEPWYAFTIQVPSETIGHVMADIQQKNGTFQSPEPVFGDKIRLTGTAPVSTMLNYPMELISFTKGKGRIQLQPAGYHPCHNEKEVIAAIGYEKDRDLDNPSSSVFCSHGAGFEVKWYEVDAMRHLP